MMKKILFGSILAGMLLLPGCSNKEYVVRFDGSKEMSGAKIAINDVNPDLPDDWSGYNFVTVEFKISTAQRFQLGFTTDCGYNELRIMSYVPNAWNRLSIPLRFFTAPPDPEADLAATNNQPRFTGWINLGGERGPLKGVDSVGFRMRRAIGKPELHLRNITLSVDDPGDCYLGDGPAIDRFGQSILVDYPEKVHSLEELKACWSEEERDSYNVVDFGYSRFGGYRCAKVDGTGYFTVRKVDGKWWFVDPDGYLFLSVGVDCVNLFNGGSVRAYEKRPGMFEELPPADLPVENEEKSFRSFGEWNIYRRYGDDYRQRALDNTIDRMDRWGINTIANWSSSEVKAAGRKAFLHQVYEMGQTAELMGLCDIYDQEVLNSIAEAVRRQTEEFVGNPWLVGYFIGNEPAWLNQEQRLCDIILEGPDRPIKTALASYLNLNGDSPENRKAFIYKSFGDYLRFTDAMLEKYDPEHLNLGIRFGDPLTIPDEIIRMCSVFDVFSFNCYDLLPRGEMMDKVKNLIDIPMIIGEYHFGTVDRGYAQSLWQVESQQQRGVAYRYYTEHAYSHPSLIGTGYFQWSDQDITGRFDGENYNCGLVDVTDRPYKEQVNAMKETALRLYDIHCGSIAPFDEIPVNCRGHELVPDLWNE